MRNKCYVVMRRRMKEGSYTDHPLMVFTDQVNADHCASSLYADEYVMHYVLETGFSESEEDIHDPKEDR